jgi:hypothetical protein
MPYNTSIQQLTDPFDPLPAFPPAMLLSATGVPMTREQQEIEDRQEQWTYPADVLWDGVMLDDPSSPLDIEYRIHQILEILCSLSAGAVERDLCNAIGVDELRTYLRKPNAGGFWMDHVKRYSKSRRKAPIYWYLRSLKGNYGLWLYYHRLNKDILFKALLNFVEPKLNLEENNLAQLKQRREAVGTTGREGRQVEKDLDKQESFLSELYDFRDKLRRAADLNLEPDLNDGVVLNIAPLWELVPWKEAEKYCKELIAGKYEWSSIGKQLRERGLVKQ